MNDKDIVQIDYLEDSREIKINLPSKALDSINYITITRLGETEVSIERFPNDYMVEDKGKIMLITDKAGVIKEMRGQEIEKLKMINAQYKTVLKDILENFECGKKVDEMIENVLFLA